LQANFPKEYKLVLFSPAHFLLLTPTDEVSINVRVIPDYLNYLSQTVKTGQAYTILKNNKVYCCFGVFPLLPGRGEAWMIRNARADPPTLPLLRAIRSLIPTISRSMRLQRVQMVVNTQVMGAQRFAEYLKFECEGLLRAFGPDGSDYFMYSRIFD